MDTYTILILLLIGALAGAFSGLLGIGGGLVIIPLLVMLLHYSQKSAQGTSLALFSIPIGIVAMLNYYKAGYVNIYHALVMVVSFLVSSYLVSKFAITLPDVYLKKIFGVFLILYALNLLFSK